jgi:hypothetical protein
LEVFEERERYPDLRGTKQSAVLTTEREDGLHAALERRAGCPGEDAGDIGEDGISCLPRGLAGWSPADGGGVAVEVGVADELGRERVGGDGCAVELEESVVNEICPSGSYAR